MLRIVDWQLFTDVSGQPVGPIFKGQVVIRPETSVTNSQSTLRNISDERRCYSHRGEGLKACKNCRVLLHYLYTTSSCNKTGCLLYKPKPPSVDVIRKLRVWKLGTLGKS
jgi:hypothetical protein